MVTLTFLSINLVLAGGRPLEIVSDLSMGDLRSRKILYLIVFFLLSPQDNIYRKIEKADYPSPGFANRPIVGLGDLSIDMFLEVLNKNIIKSYSLDNN